MTLSVLCRPVSALCLSPVVACCASVGLCVQPSGGCVVPVWDSVFSVAAENVVTDRRTERGRNDKTTTVTLDRCACRGLIIVYL